MVCVWDKKGEENCGGTCFHDVFKYQRRCFDRIRIDDCPKVIIESRHEIEENVHLGKTSQVTNRLLLAVIYRAIADRFTKMYCSLTRQLPGNRQITRRTKEEMRGRRRTAEANGTRCRFIRSPCLSSTPWGHCQ